MAIPGETIATGAPATCDSCGQSPKLDVYQSHGTGMYYIGTYCYCGPYSRESRYFKDRDAADKALAEWKKNNRVGIRTTEFNQDGNLEVIDLENADG